MDNNTLTEDATSAAIKKLTPQGIVVMTTIADGKISFFDAGLTAGSGSWGEVLAKEDGIKPGVLTGLAKQGLLVAGEAGDEGAGKWWELTELGAAVANQLKTPAAKATRKSKKADKATTEAATSDKPMTRSQCREALDRIGYKGPTSFLMPKLREIVRQETEKFSNHNTPATA